MSDSSSSDAPLRLVVLCDGQPQAYLPIISCSVRHALNAVPSARLVISDGDMPSQCSPLSDSALFRPGAEVEIRAGYGDQDRFPERFQVRDTVIAIMQQQTDR